MRRKESARWGTVIGLVALLAFALPLQALAFECVARMKEANQALSQAEQAVFSVSDAKTKGQVSAYIAVAKQLSAEADTEHKDAAAKKSAEGHYRSAAKAKAAKALADMALAAASK
ncbi:MAG: hypothetical protein HYV08_15275 [Deltaproteobacteria bacterium]|nr:hypothetical protein [Deltaproteobacteria bacterium]MBI3076269.1 hypothetical protein [Deltaproteobacteria bacterium]